MINYDLSLRMNRRGVARNVYQGDTPRVLFICSAGILRSATGAHIFSSDPYNWNTRTCGAEAEYALNPVTEAVLLWADEIYLMENDHIRLLEKTYPEEVLGQYRDKMHVLNIPDNFGYRDPELVKLLTDRVLTASRFGKTS